MEMDMKIAVIGATGTAGRKVVEHINAAGHEAVEISRSTGVDITTGEGLEAPLAGAEVGMHAASPWPAEGEGSGELLAGVMRRVGEGTRNAGLKGIRQVSIINIDKAEVAKFDYYRAKALQEEVLGEGSVPCSIVRSAQWMEFALNPAAAEEHVDEVHVADWYIQPIAVDDVAKTLVEVATGAPGNRTIAGPEPIRLPDLRSEGRRVGE